MATLNGSTPAAGMMSKQKSLFLKESAFYAAAIVATAHVGDDLNDDPNALKDTDAMIKIARRFLAESAPDLLQVLDTKADCKSTNDRLVKIGRNVSSTMRHSRRMSSSMTLRDTEDKKEAETEMVLSKEKIDASLGLLADESSNLATLLKGDAPKVPKVRFGKTELQMPVVTLGCMRFQQSWNRGSASTVVDMSNVEAECQENLVEIIRYAHQCGVNHIETAKGYGSSQLQMGFALKTLFDAGEMKREDLIIQTKGGVSASMSVADYKQLVLDNIKLLQLDYIDLFSAHGVNTQEEFDLLFNNPKGNLINALYELKKEGKVRHIGFSTHAPADLIQKTIDTDAFEYVNLHYHFCGSYTASGDLECGGNLSTIRLAHEKDMGIFIISAYDKGGKLYAPSNKLRDLCLPDMEPMTYGSVWLWQHAMHDEKNTPIHTLVVGAARPSDLDQPVLASHMLLQDQEKLAERRQRVTDRLQKAMVESLGQEWVDSWHKGLPNAYESQYQTHLTGIVWTYNLIQAWGMLDFAKDRYGPMDNHWKNWSKDKTKEENLKKMGGFGWMPGVAYSDSLDYSKDLSNCPEQNRERLLQAVESVHNWASKEGSKKSAEVPLEWEMAYDMRPWTAFPER